MYYKMAARPPDINHRTECSICLNVFRIPKALPCLHTFCQECLQFYVNSSFNQKDRSFSCPVCRAVCRPGKIAVKDIVKNLPTNFYVHSEADLKEETRSNTKPPAEPHLLPVYKSYLDKIEGLEKQIHGYQKQMEYQHRRNMMWAHSVQHDAKFYPGHSNRSYMRNDAIYAQLKESKLAKKNHDCLDKFLQNLEKLREETIRFIIPLNVEEIIHDHQKPNKRKRKKRQNKSKTSENEVDSLNNIEQNLISFKDDLEKTFEQLTISRSENENELKTFVDKIHSVSWADQPPSAGDQCVDGGTDSVFLKVEDVHSNGHVFPRAGEFLYICSVKVLDNDTVVVCGRSPNLLLCYDGNSGLMTSPQLELEDEPSNMSFLIRNTVMVTFLNEMKIAIIDCDPGTDPPFIESVMETKKLYVQVICLSIMQSVDLNWVTPGYKKILAVFKKNRTYNYHVLHCIDYDPETETLDTGRIPGLHAGSRVDYIKQRDIIVYPDTTRKCLLGFCLSSKTIAFKYYGDVENPVVQISDVCCGSSFIFVADKRHHKVHKLGFNGTMLDIINCLDFNFRWPLHVHVNRLRTMVICCQRRDTSYDLKTFLC